MIGDETLQAFRSAGLYQVASLGDSVSQVVISDGAASWAVFCLSSYRVRAVGDQVLAARLGGGGWVCFGKVGADDHPPADVTYGNGAPAGGGWRQSTSAYVRDNIDGSVSIYLDTGGSVPLPATVSAVGARGWLANTTTAVDLPRAGAASLTEGDWSGGWWYGTGIQAACVGKTVAKMTVRVARTSGGRNGPALLRMGLHTSTGLPVALTNTWIPGGSLDRNGSVTVDIPATQRGLLANGTVTGIGVWGTGPNEYAEFTNSADVTITFG